MTLAGYYLLAALTRSSIPLCYSSIFIAGTVVLSHHLILIARHLTFTAVFSHDVFHRLHPRHVDHRHSCWYWPIQKYHRLPHHTAKRKARHVLHMSSLLLPTDVSLVLLQYTGMTNFDTGDAKGDVFFGIYELSIPEICKSHSTSHLPQVEQTSNAHITEFTSPHDFSYLAVRKRPNFIDSEFQRLRGIDNGVRGPFRVRAHLPFLFCAWPHENPYCK